MAKNFPKQQNGITLVPQNTISPTDLGDLRYNSATNKVELYNGAIDPVVTEADVATLTNKTIDAGTNTVSNLTNTNLSGSAAISNANLAAMPSVTFKGNVTGGSATPSDLTASQVVTALNLSPSTIGTIDSQTPSSNGLVTSAGVFYAQSASATNPGMVNNTTQVLSGAKTFNNNITVASGNQLKLNGSVSGTFSQNAASTTSSYGIVWPSAQASSGQYPVNDGSGNLTWTSSSTTPYELVNLGLASAISSTSLVLALTQSNGSNPSTAAAAVKIAMRSSTASTGSYSERSVTAPLSFTLAGETSLGMLGSQNNNLWIYAIDSDGSGTIKLGASTVQYDDSVLQSTLAESFTAAYNFSTLTWTASGHGMPIGTAINLTASVLPVGYSAGTQYYVVTTATNTFQLSATPNGSAVSAASTNGTSNVIHIADGSLVSDGVYTNKPIRIIGKGVFNLTTPGTTWVTPSVLSIATQLMSPQTYAAQYRCQSGQVVSTNTVTLVNFNIIVNDTVSQVTTGSGWKFIVQKPGRYDVQSGINFVASPATHGYIYVYRNGAEVYQSGAPAFTSGTGELTPNIATTISCSKGDYLDVRIFQESGGNVALDTSGNKNWICITRVGD